jgi:SAM-dependent methyltransferase
MYHHYLGGRGTFQADRDAAEQVLAALPEMRESATAAREFIGRAVRFLAGEAGIDQFLDLGAGLPDKLVVHEVAAEVNPAARVAYVDFDPVVVSHGNAFLAKPGVSVVARGDVRRPAELLALPEIRAHLDFDRPIAVLAVSVLHFVSDADDPHAVVAAIRDALAPGSYLALAHGSIDFVSDKSVVRRVLAAYEKSNAPAWPRGRASVLRFFEGFELVEPGLVPKPRWRPEPGRDVTRADGVSWCGVGRLVLGRSDAQPPTRVASLMILISAATASSASGPSAVTVTCWPLVAPRPITPSTLLASAVFAPAVSETAAVKLAAATASAPAGRACRSPASVIVSELAGMPSLLRGPGDRLQVRSRRGGHRRRDRALDERRVGEHYPRVRLVPEHDPHGEHRAAEVGQDEHARARLRARHGRGDLLRARAEPAVVRAAGREDAHCTSAHLGGEVRRALGEPGAVRHQHDSYSWAYL